jgi:hypothetical protein
MTSSLRIAAAIPALAILSSLALPANAQPVGSPPSELPPPPPGAPPPLSAAPPPPGTPPPPPAAPPGVEVRFAPDTPGLTVHRETGVMPIVQVGGPIWLPVASALPVFTAICIEPCAARLVPGTYRLALSKEGGDPVPVAERVALDRPAVLHSSYVDRSGLRIAGWFVFAAGAIGGFVMSAAAFQSEQVCDSTGSCQEQTRIVWPWIVASAASFVVGAVVGLVLRSQSDEAHVRIEALTLPSVGGTEGRSAFASLGTNRPAQGVALGVVF